MRGSHIQPVSVCFKHGVMQLVDSTRKSEGLPGGRARLDIRMGPGERVKVAARAGVHLRHVFPGKFPAFPSYCQIQPLEQEAVVQSPAPRSRPVTDVS